MRTGDFNGDGLQDFILNEQDTPNWYFAFNKGNFTFNKVALPLISATGQGCTDKDNTVDNCLVNDFDNDGKSDVIIFDGIYDCHDPWIGNSYGIFNNFKTYWYKSTGNNVILKKIATSTNEADVTYTRYVVGDFNGDGRGDLMNFGYDCYGATDMTQKWRMYSTSNTNFEGGMVTSISNGLCQHTRIEYATTALNPIYSVNTSLPSGTPTYPLSFLGNAVYVVKKVTSHVLPSNIVQTYMYTNGIVDLQRGFMGFGKFTATNTLTNASVEQNYEFKKTSGTTDYYQPFLTSTKSKVANTDVSESLIPLASYSVNPIPGISRHVFMYPTKTFQIDYLKKTVTSTTTSMDNDGSDGNVAFTLTEMKDTGPNAIVVASQKTSYNGYDKRDDLIVNPNPFKNAPANVVSEQTHKDTPDNTFTVTTAFTYNTNGTLLTKTDFSGTSKALLTSFTYDVVGNLLSTTSLDRTATLEYTSDKRFISKQFDALNYFTETQYDIWGNPLTKWDINRLKTVYQYDAWGHLTSVTAPDGQKVTSSINWFDKGDANSYKHASTLYYSSSFDGDKHFIGAEYFDAAGHSLRKAKSNFNGSVLFTDVTYNPQYLIYTTTDPYPSAGSTIKKTTNTYDDFGRIETQTLPNGVIITTTPSNDNLRKVTTTYNTGETYTKEYDAAGLLTKATDPGGSIAYTYFSNGLPKNIQPAGGAGATTITYYPETGLQETLSDPSSGLSSYDYNNFGELTSQTDGNLKNTILGYDKLGHIHTKNIGSITTTYNYYEDAGLLGLLKNIAINDVPEMCYKYDALGRLSEETRSKGTNAFTYKYEYDTKSRVNKLTYPNAMALTYGYNSISGDLTSIVKDGTVLWSLGTTITDVNDLGQIAKVTLGNGKSTFYGYDTQDRLTSIIADNIINFSYQFNDQQQLEFRDETMFNGTAMKGFKESFTYDAVNRLETATKDNNNAPLIMTYMAGANDRIATKSDAATYNYPDLSKYQVDNLSDLKNQFPSHDLTYNDEGLTTLVTETNEGIINKTLTLEYGLDGQRFKTEYTQDGASKYTRYYFDSYEKEVEGSNTRHLNYIYAGGALIAICEQKDNTDIMHYVYTDYLGSLRCVTSDNGTIEQRLSYDAWGGRRDYLTGLKLTDAQVAEATMLTSHGFTGQEHIDGLGLINLNARFYEPAMGIFLSPDNYVQALDNSQNFNRYTYCLNNPLMYTDKDGKNFAWVLAVGLAYLNSANVNHSWDPTEWNWKSAKTYTSILSGFAMGYGIGNNIDNTIADYQFRQDFNSVTFDKNIQRGYSFFDSDITHMEGYRGYGMSYGGPADPLYGPFPISGVEITAKGHIATANAFCDNFAKGLWDATVFWFTGEAAGIVFEGAMSYVTTKWVTQTVAETGGKLVTNGVKLTKSLASEAQMAEEGITIIGPGKLKEAKRLAEQYGGNAIDWVKKSSLSFSKNGTTFETHWYENILTRNKVEFKTVFPKIRK